MRLTKNAKSYYAELMKQKKAPLLNFILFLGFILNCGLSLQGQTNWRFIPNEGQITDRNGQTRQDILFSVEDHQIFLAKTGITYILDNSDEINHEVHEKVEEIEESEEGLGIYSEMQWHNYLLRKEKMKVQQVSMRFRKSKKDVQIASFGKSNDYLNYYTVGTGAGKTNIHLYDSIMAYNIYDGIDVHYYAEGKGLKYDILVSAGVNPNCIKMDWTGADSVYVNAEGHLIAQTEVGRIEERLPLAYQIVEGQRIRVPAAYEVKNRSNGAVVTFALGDYDQKSPLIIDPWITNYGGESPDQGKNITTDNEGDVILAGTTLSNFMIAEDGFSLVNGGWYDAFVAKLSPTGDRIWGTFYGGIETDGFNEVTTDSDNNIIVTGATESSEGISFDGFQNDYGGDSFEDLYVTGDAMVVKFNAEGARIWATYYGGERGEAGIDVYVGPDNTICVTGLTNSEENISSPGGFNEEYADTDFIGYPFDVFLVKFTADGDRLWGTYYGSVWGETSATVAVDSEGNIFLAGGTGGSEGIATPGSYQETSGGGFDAFLTKFDPEGDRIWGTFFGGEFTDNFNDIEIDTADVIFIAGESGSVTGIAFDGYQMEFGGNWDAILTSFSNDGELLWSTYFGGTGREYALSIDIDQQTNTLLIAGDTYSIDLPVSDCATQDEINGTENAFIAQYLSTGELFCSSYLGTSHEEDNTACYGPDCFLYAAGSSPESFSTPGSFQEAYGGGEFDAFVAQVYKNSCGMEAPEFELTGLEKDVENCTECDGELTVYVSGVGCSGLNAYASFIWSTGDETLSTLDSSSTISGLCPGSYSVIVQLNCAATDTLFFELGEDFAYPEAEFFWTNVCVGDTTFFTNMSFAETSSIEANSWKFGDTEISTQENPFHIYDEPGTYFVTLVVENNFGCMDSITHEIVVYPNYNLAESLVICSDEFAILQNGDTLFVNETGNYISNFVSIHGCDSIITITVTAEEAIISYDTIFVEYKSNWISPDGIVFFIADTTDHVVIYSEEGCDSTLYMTVIPKKINFLPPNVFTPGQDSANNTFFFPAEGVVNFKCIIVNRWGVEVFRFNSITDEWDGANQKNGKPCADGVYFYVYSGTFANGEVFEGQGNVHLLSE